jgi:nitroimidazol reductase NimA-like FMN-containing flavoprotein (pyridoxamine 5'-phosphate oxidase superfamily)
MRHRDKEVRDRDEIDAIIGEALVCRLALARADEPYVVPISFGYDGDSIFIHTARSGRKIDFFEANDRVCFELEAKVELHSHDSDACAWTFEFSSVIGYGTIREVTDTEGKRDGLLQIMRHYSDRGWDITDDATATTRVWRIDIESLTGKRSSEKPVSKDS